MEKKKIEEKLLILLLDKNWCNTPHCLIKKKCLQNCEKLFSIIISNYYYHL